jgi:hypothetical protein
MRSAASALISMPSARAREKAGDAPGAKADYASAVRDFVEAIRLNADAESRLDDRLEEARRKAAGAGEK